VSSLAPCLVRRDRERPDAVVRFRADPNPNPAFGDGEPGYDSGHRHGQGVGAARDDMGAWLCEEARRERHRYDWCDDHGVRRDDHGVRHR
jgi:hypothetical protein